MKTQKEIEQLAFKFYADGFLKGSFIHGYTQCQKDMALSQPMEVEFKIVEPTIIWKKEIDLEDLRDKLFDLLSDFKNDDISKIEFIDDILPHLQKPVDYEKEISLWAAKCGKLHAEKNVVLMKLAKMQKPVESDAVEFAEWCDKQTILKETTFKELYEQFKQLNKQD